MEEDVLLQDVMECGDDSSSDWLDPSAAPTCPGETFSLSTEASTSKNGKN